MREARVYCEIHPHDVSDDFVRGFGAKGIILSGSHMSAYEESTGKAPAAVFGAGVPVLGICYGMQTMAQQPVVHEHARQLRADRAMPQRCAH